MVVGLDHFKEDLITAQGLAMNYPEDHEIAVLHAEALMDLRPWDYWAENGEPNPGIREALASLEAVIKANENHPGACHFFIHAVEKLYRRSLAVMN